MEKEKKIDKIVIFGANGQVGSQVANQLINDGYSIRVVIRNNKNEAEWKNKNVEIFYGNILNINDISKSMQGMDGAFLINPPAYQDENHFETCKKIVSNYVQALQKNPNIKKIVFLSSIGAHLNCRTGNIYTAYLIEQGLKNINIPIVFIRAGAFIENLKNVVQIVKEKGIMPSFYTPLDTKIPHVSSKDIAFVTSDIFKSNLNSKRIIELYSQMYSPNDIAKIFSKLLKKEIKAVSVPEENWNDILTSWGFSPFTVKTYCEMIHGINNKYICFEGKHIDKKGVSNAEEVLTKYI